MVGKSTAAISLAAKLMYPCISTDDIGGILQTVLDINPMRGQYYLDYYAYNDKEKLIEDAIKYHAEQDAAIEYLIETHSASWGSPLIVEGYALYPSKLMRRDENVFSVWLIADENLLRNRLLKNTGFYENAKEPQKVIENYLHRSIWHNQTILEQCKAEGKNHILVTEELSTDEIITSVIDMMDKELR